MDEDDLLDREIVTGFGFEQHLLRLGQIDVAAGIDEGDLGRQICADLDGVADRVAVSHALGVGEGEVVVAGAADSERDAGAGAVEGGGDCERVVED